jgi:hypothetical protein
MDTLLALIFSILGLSSSPPAQPARVDKPARCESAFAIFCPARAPEGR